jgi:geranylgeranyl pyrophosphate synthase
MITAGNIDDYLIEDIIHDLLLVDEEILTHLQSEPPLLGEIGYYLISAGGKRVRPALTLLSFRAAGTQPIEVVVPIAAAIELIHTASLIHDDINDGTDLRRGILTANRKFGNSSALVAGDYLFVKAFRIGGKYDWEIVRIIADACALLAEGEIQQDLNQYNTDLSINEYLDTIHKKTASLISACSQVGAVLSGASSEIVEALTKFAFNIGMAFQITDDMLDVKGVEADTGKPTGNDIRDGQLSVVSIKALEQLKGDTKDELQTIIRKKENSDDEIKRAIDLIMSTDSMTFADTMANEYADKARDELHKLDESDYRDNLELIIEMIIQRSF